MRYCRLLFGEWEWSCPSLTCTMLLDHHHLRHGARSPVQRIARLSAHHFASIINTLHCIAHSSAHKLTH